LHLHEPRGQQKGTGGLGKGPAASGPKFENRQPRRGWIMGPSVGIELFHAGVLYSDLLAKELDLLLEPIIFRLP